MPKVLAEAEHYIGSQHRTPSSLIQIFTFAVIFLELCACLLNEKVHSLPGTVALSVEDPTQCWPPFLGAGLLHCLVLVFCPAPELIVQELQDPQLPFTVKKQLRNFICVFEPNFKVLATKNHKIGPQHPSNHWDTLEEKF